MPSWHHTTLESIAQAVGRKPTDLERMRDAGAPLDGAPYDEAALRLWYASERKRGKALSEPSADVAAVLALVTEATATAAPSAPNALDAAKLAVARRQAERLAIANRRTQATLRAEATDHFRALVGRLAQCLRQRLTSPAATADVWQACQVSRHEAEPAIIAALEPLISAAMAEALT